MCEYRDVQKSIRISEDVLKFINSFSGDNFNDKLNNSFKFFISEYDNKKKDIDILQEQYDRLRIEYDDLRSALYTLDDVNALYDQFIKSMQKAINYCDDVRGCDHVDR